MVKVQNQFAIAMSKMIRIKMLIKTMMETLSVDAFLEGNRTITNFVNIKSFFMYLVTFQTKPQDMIFKDS